MTALERAALTLYNSRKAYLKYKPNGFDCQGAYYILRDSRVLRTFRKLCAQHIKKATSETRIDLLRDEITRIRADVLEASTDCYAHASLTFPAPSVTAAWINMAKRLRAIVEKTK